MALIAFRKLSLQTCMCSNPLGLHVWFLVRPFVYFHTLCVRTVKALARLGQSRLNLRCSPMWYLNFLSWLKLLFFFFSFIAVLFLEIWVCVWLHACIFFMCMFYYFKFSSFNIYNIKSNSIYLRSQTNLALSGSSLLISHSRNAGWHRANRKSFLWYKIPDRSPSRCWKSSQLM